MSRILVSVTRNDIRNGVRIQPDSCPIALALKREGFGNPHVSDRVWDGYDVEWNRNYIGNISRAARRFMAAFDAGKRGGIVRPFRFFLTLIDQ